MNLRRSEAVEHEAIDRLVLMRAEASSDRVSGQIGKSAAAPESDARIVPLSESC